MKFNIGDIVLHDDAQYRVMESYDGCIVLHSNTNGPHHGVTLVQGQKHYKQLRKYLPEILKKL